MIDYKIFNKENKKEYAVGRKANFVLLVIYEIWNLEKQR